MFDKAVKDIKSLKIQGAEKVAKAAVSSLHHVIHKSKARNSTELIRELHQASKQLSGARPTEPCLRNALKFVLRGLDRRDIMRTIKCLDNNIRQARNYFRQSDQKIADFGSRKIKRNFVVFTHCHSNTVMLVLAKSRFDKKRFEVHNCETRPKFQGRMSAKELSALGIPVKHYVDSAVRHAMRHSDLFLFGADAVQSDGRIVNKIGTELFLEVAHKYDVPSYCCTMSWKFDPRTLVGFDEPIENRNYKEIWPNPPKNVTIMNPAFEVIDPQLVTGIISEHGIYSPAAFVDEVRRCQQWMFQ
jgi:ribose 1,5-bisphosphate isomerase